MTKIGGQSITVLAVNTCESSWVIRVGPVVYKLFKPVKWFSTCRNHHLRCPPEVRIQQLRIRAEESLRPPLNPVLYVEPLNLFVSRFVEGRQPTGDELQPVVRATEDSGRAYISDWRTDNAVITPDGRVVLIDWHIDLRAWFRSR